MFRKQLFKHFSVLCASRKRGPKGKMQIVVSIVRTGAGGSISPSPVFRKRSTSEKQEL